MKRTLLIASVVVIASLLVSACASPKPAAKLAPVADLPDTMQHAPASVRTAYQFALANPEPLADVPCYCGCGSIGHHSNLACYIKDTREEGKPVFDDHALGCSICVDIALDVKKMMEEGKEQAAIRQQIVQTYSAFGPSNQ